MHFVESRLLEIERLLRDLLRSAAELAARVAALEQQQALQGGGGGGGGGGSSGGYFGCTLSANLAGGSSLTNQTVWQLASGSRSNVTTTGTVYHDGPTPGSDLSSGDQAILAANGDGTYSVIGRFCT